MISALFLTAGTHSTTNLKTCKQSKTFFKPANAQSPSEESLQEKCQTFIGMRSIFTWICKY